MANVPLDLVSEPDRTISFIVPSCFTIDPPCHPVERIVAALAFLAEECPAKMQQQIGNLFAQSIHEHSSYVGVAAP